MTVLKEKFYHFGNGKTYNLETDKSFIVIYGKNGSGKTTFSRNKSFDERFVFNEDYVNKNVYNTDPTGSNISADTRKNLSELWIGDNIIQEVKRRAKFDESHKINSKLLKQEKSKYEQEISSNGLNDLLDLSDKKIENFELHEDNISETMKNFKYESKPSIKIKEEKEFKRTISLIRNNIAVEGLLNKISENALLKELILGYEVDGIIASANTNLEKLNHNKQSLLDVEEYLTENPTRRQQEKLLKEMYSVHNKYKLTYCLFCNNQNVQEEISKLKRIFEDETRVIKDNVLKLLKSQILYISSLYEDETNKRVSPEICDYLVNLVDILEKYQNSISNNDFKRIEVHKFSGESNLLKLEEARKDASMYIADKYIDKLVFLHNNDLVLKESINGVKQEIDKLMDDSAKDNAEGVNNILGKLGLGHKTSVKVNKRGSNYTFEVSVDGRSSVGTLSKGERHRLAFALFLFTIEKLNYKDKTIVIDDPVISLDALAYHHVKQYLKNHLIKNFRDKGNVKLVLLSHDFNYIFVQLFGLEFERGIFDKTGIYRIGKENFEEIDLDMIFMDDIVLFKRLLNKIENIDELKKVPHIAQKIFRLLVDIKQRLMNVPQTEDICIAALNLQANDSKVCSDYQNHYYSNFRGKETKHFESDLVYENIKLMKEAVDTLGFHEIIENKVLDKLEIILKNEINGVKNENIIFDIVDAVNNYLDNDKNGELVNYINHPRNSFTKNLTTLILDSNI